MTADGKYEIGCHNCQHLVTEEGVGSRGGGCAKHPKIIWPDTDEILVCCDFKCRFELSPQPNYENLDQVFEKRFKRKMKAYRIYSYIPHGTVPVLTSYSMNPFLSEDGHERKKSRAKAARVQAGKRSGSRTKKETTGTKKKAVKQKTAQKKTTSKGKAIRKEMTAKKKKTAAKKKTTTKKKTATKKPRATATPKRKAKKRPVKRKRR